MEINHEECGVCEDCIEVCPEGAIKKKGYKIVITDDCTDCGECIDICPVGAIYKEE
ncbi:4Fe-4S binding protein [Methanobrevibacter sp. OttesenSCG-928-K11]|nr:4Fe-4S binding protein [Methanobrevibacter sp. OttesenSCG-928-K11]MDL2271086.1 4Fe-4S binding protein [Methanobrevibacter sp. OttesenSCG-928-I08]